jgi:hypothetical protein
LLYKVSQLKTVHLAVQALERITAGSQQLRRVRGGEQERLRDRREPVRAGMFMLVFF